MLKSTDPTWTITNAMYWSVIETNVGILAASIPSFKALAKRYLPIILGEYSPRGDAYPSKDAPAGSNGAFQRITKANESVHMRSLGHSKSRSIPTDKELYHSKVDIDTNIDGDSPNTSEEELTGPPPKGRIVARTQIQTIYEGNHTMESGQDRSFYIQ